MVRFCSMTGGTHTHLAICMPRLKTWKGHCSNTAPIVPPSTISKAVGWTSELTCPPSSIWPPMIATRPNINPAKLSLSKRLPLALLAGDVLDLADQLPAQTRDGLTVQLAYPGLGHAHDFTDFPQVEILFVVQGHH